MLTVNVSCSECKLETIHKRWTITLLNWLNKCVATHRKVNRLNLRSLVEIVDKYKNDICTDDTDRAILCSDDLEPFLTYKYHLLRLSRTFPSDKDLSHKLYIMTSLLMYHCCMNSITGQVDKDICELLNEDEQLLIVKFCENLNEIEVTVANIRNAIEEACLLVPIPSNCAWSSEELIAPPNSLSSKFSPNPSNEKLHSTNQPERDKEKLKRTKFKSSITILPSTSIEPSYSKASICDSDTEVFMAEHSAYTDNQNLDSLSIFNMSAKDNRRLAQESLAIFPVKYSMGQDEDETGGLATKQGGGEPGCLTPKTAQDNILKHPNVEEDIKGSPTKMCSARPKSTPPKKLTFHWGVYCSLLLLVIIAIVGFVFFARYKSESYSALDPILQSLKLENFDAHDDFSEYNVNWTWRCTNKICNRVSNSGPSAGGFMSLSRCSLVCGDPPLWPLPTGHMNFSKHIISLTTAKLEYKLNVASNAVTSTLADAFKLFLRDLGKLEKNLKKRHLNNKRRIIMEVNVDFDINPRFTMDTDESYMLKLKSTAEAVSIFVTSPSFCGVRHGLETLSQLILPDQSTGSLITLSKFLINDSPSFRYRGLMLDTARNFIAVKDIMKTIDGMAMVKLNTFHWRISDATSFPLHIPDLPQFYEYGAYSKEMVYSTNDVASVVERAQVRGIRVLIEVAVPGFVGRAWSWSKSSMCSSKNANASCTNELCLSVSNDDEFFKHLGLIYKQILNITKVNDVFHLSDGTFSVANCHYEPRDRFTFLQMALKELKKANQGVLPKLTIVWHSPHLIMNAQTKKWRSLGVQVDTWDSNRNLMDYRVIHSSRWDLSCEINKQRCTKYKTWQEMYSWRSWRNLKVLAIEGGDAMLWTDLVNSGNLDSHLWPRLSAVAERLWSDAVIANPLTGTPITSHLYVRLNFHRWRLVRRGIKAQPIWNMWCSYHPEICLQKRQSTLK